jgi:malonyl-CoA/methylmalonyl-CoA synthetase
MQLSFPAISPFPELVRQSQRSPDKIILRDHASSKTATAGELLRSVSSLRNKLNVILMQNGLYDCRKDGDDRFIFLLAPPGLEYVVSMLTIFSLGAAMSAQCKQIISLTQISRSHSNLAIVIRPEDIKRYFKLSKPLALLYSSALAEKVEAIKTLCAEKDSGINPELPFVEIQTVYPASFDSLICCIEFATRSKSTQTGSLFFTSGTSGNQKGVVHSYEALLASARERIGTWKLTEDDVVLNQKPGNWMGGIFAIIPTLISGACLYVLTSASASCQSFYSSDANSKILICRETCAEVFNPKWFWERISQGDVSIFDIAPTGYDRLMQYFDEHISGLPPIQKEPFIQGIIDTRVAGVSGSLLLPHTQNRWTELRRGKPLLNLYGSTEVTLICSMKWENPDYANLVISRCQFLSKY